MVGATFANAFSNIAAPAFTVATRAFLLLATLFGLMRPSSLASP
jgi:hypothetical protein